MWVISAYTKKEGITQVPDAAETAPGATPEAKLPSLPSKGIISQNTDFDNTFSEKYVKLGKYKKVAKLVTVRMIFEAIMNGKMIIINGKETTFKLTIKIPTEKQTVGA